MKKFLKWTLITLLSLVGIYCLIALFGASTYKVERKKDMTAPVEIIYSQISHLKNWNSWTAWATMDTNAVWTFGGTDGEVGSSMTWKGDPEKVGEGKIVLTELIPNEKIGYELTFVDMNSVSNGAFTLTASGEKTNVSWTNEGKIPFLFRPITMLFMSMDDMMGKDFETGLNKLDSLTQQLALTAVPQIPAYEIQTVVRPATQYLGIRFDTLITAIDSSLFSSAYGEIMAYMEKNKIEMAGAPVCITYSWDEVAGRCELVPAIPVILSNTKSDKRVERFDFLRTEALCIDYYGAYENIWMAHMAMDQYMLEHSKKSAVSIEEYVTDPMTVSTMDSVLTKLYYILE